MKTSLRITLSILITCALGLAWGLHFLRMELADGADYTEQDTQQYEFYTPDLLKKMPRITESYRFHYSNVSGPNPARIFQLRFTGVTDNAPIKTYIERNGYKKSEACSFAGDCWAGQDPDIRVTVEVREKPRSLLITLVDKRA
ncbi:hypothetical protein [Candidatus Pantoea soli]|uniref:Uncharacterized protein n=1 Tax=Candidatus Pantoea soli TaxID=3098669 RepID=A0A518XC50_9GAMM|nr:hypothetical protein [Pantoea soli]QDY41656.1 hypothetical protein D8B20_07025 [Pantoea soli]